MYIKCNTQILPQLTTCTIPSSSRQSPSLSLEGPANQTRPGGHASRKMGEVPATSSRCPSGGRWGQAFSCKILLCLAPSPTGIFGRSKPVTMHRAAEFRREPTPAEAKLWAYLRGDKFIGVRFRRHKVLPSRTVVLAARTVAFPQEHAIGNYIADFCSVKAKLVIELDGTSFGRTTWSRKSTTRKELNCWKIRVTGYCAFGTRM